MYRNKSFNRKASVVKTVLMLAFIGTLGLTLSLHKPIAWAKLGSSLAFLTVANPVRPTATEAGSHHGLIIQAPSALPEGAEKVLMPSPQGSKTIAGLADFTYPAKVATPAVVHIKARQGANSAKRAVTNPLDQLFREFFGEGLRINPREYVQPEQFSVGSGVIYTSDGYIITNNHVIEGADRIEVTLHDNRFYEAKLVGADPNTDLALLKISEGNLPFLALGNSDTLEVGEWVLAVGNPFTLNSTVTKGIVSAKARQLDGLHSGHGKTTIQSFIQTDAVINMGNSGGALVNLYGELIGINTAIASPSSAFVGYGFAIPSSLVKKVVGDLKQYGLVQRVVLGVRIADVDAQLAKDLGLTNVELVKKLGLNRLCGVYIYSIEPNSPCAKLIQKEDVITQINERKINKVAELQEIVGCSKPGDKITITLYRKGKEKTVSVTLEKAADPLHLVQKNNLLQVEGVTFQEMDAKTKTTLRLSAGVLVAEVAKGKFQSAGLKKGYVLLSFDKQPVHSIKALAEMIRNTKGAGLLEVLDPNSNLISYLAVELSQQPNYHHGRK